MSDTYTGSKGLRDAVETRLVHLKANREHWLDINERLRRGEAVTIESSNGNDYHGDEIAFLEKVLEGLPTIPAERRPPQHPFEVRISIGGDDWDYVRRAIRELNEMVQEREPEHVGCSSGGGGGCHTIDVFRRDVSVEQFRKELAEWHQGLLAQRAATP